MGLKHNDNATHSIANQMCYHYKRSTSKNHIIIFILFQQKLDVKVAIPTKIKTRMAITMSVKITLKWDPC